MTDPVKGLPHDIQGLFPYETPWWVYAGVALGAVVLVAALILLVKLLARKGGAKANAVDPWDELAARVKALAPAEPFAGRAAEDYFYRLSLFLREGVERRTRLNATDMTLQELRDPLRKKLPLPTAEIERVVAFLARADEVKFAGAKTSIDEAKDARRDVGQWLLALKPREVTDLAGQRAADGTGAARGGTHAAR